MIYLDFAATTPVNEEVKKTVSESLDEFGNPSSVYSAGVSAKRLLEKSRQTVSGAIGIRPGDKGRVVFTSSGSEGNNTALCGVAFSKKRFARGRVIISDSEHPSVKKTASFLCEQGFDIVEVPTLNGEIDKDFFFGSLTPDTFLVSLMTVNNETGAVYDIRDIFEKTKNKYPDIILHTDAVQGFMKTDISPAESHADLITVSGHKIYAPKGIGALYISERVIKTKSLVPVIHGGGQEYGFRSGTENTAYAAGFAKACEIYGEDKESVVSVRNKIISGLDCEVKVNTPVNYCPGILSLTLPGIKSETMVNYLSGNGIFISAGSACSSNGGEKSYALRNFGLSGKDADCTVRVSFDGKISEKDLSLFISTFNKGVSELVRF